MLNVQHFEKELIEIRRKADTFGVKNGIPCACNGMECLECGFSFTTCEEEAIKWLNSKYEEKDFNWDHDIDWRNVPINTDVLVSDFLTGEWNQARFCIFLPECGDDYPFITFSNNKVREHATTITRWKYCKLLNKKDIEKYMYFGRNVEKTEDKENSYGENVWREIPQYTRVKVRDDETDEWKVKYFAFYHPEMERKFWTFGSDGNDYMASGWKECMLLPEKD